MKLTDTPLAFVNANRLWHSLKYSRNKYLLMRLEGILKAISRVQDTLNARAFNPSYDEEFNAYDLWFKLNDGQTLLGTLWLDEKDVPKCFVDEDGEHLIEFN